MKQEYNKLFEKITPLMSNEELLCRMLRKAENMEQKRKIKLKKPATVICAVLAALSLSIVSGAAIYTGISYLEKTEIVSNETIAEKINTYVYEDSRKNMRMTVEEFLTDGRVAHLLLHYEALTDEGIEWFDKGMNIYGKMATSGGHDKYLINGPAGLYEDLKKYRTEKDRYFFISQFDCVERGKDIYDEITLVYPMITDSGATRNYSAFIPLNNRHNVEITNYRLIGDSGSELYQPKYLSISDLSVFIYGDGYGLTEEHKNYRRLSDNFYTVNEEIEKTIYLVMSDGSRINLIYGGMGIDEHGLCEEFDCNMTLFEGTYHGYTDENNFTNISINSENVSAVEINGVTYELEKIK